MLNLLGRRAALKATLATMLVAGSGVSMGESIQLYNRSQDIGTLSTDLATTPFWTRLAAGQSELSDCDPGSQSTTGKGLKPAAERLVVRKRFLECLTQLRSIAIVSNPNFSAQASTAFDAAIARATENVEETQGETDFMGLSFGVGVGVSFSQDDLITEAEVGADNNIRVVKDESDEPRVILESHYYGWCKSASCNAGARGIGPYFAIVAKDDKLISAFSAGVMFGWKDTKRGESDGFSVGLGAILDSDVTSLAKGFEVGKPLPEGEADVKYETKSRWGAIVFFTRTF